jgi:hypothetical protein
MLSGTKHLLHFIESTQSRSLALLQQAAEKALRRVILKPFVWN